MPKHIITTPNFGGQDARRLGRFVAVGIVNTLFGYGAFIAALASGLATGASLAVATLLGVVFNFATTGRLVFGNKEPHRFWRFLAVYAAIFVCNAVLLVFLENAGFTPAVGQAMLLIPIVALTYLLNRQFVFGAQP
jgi:putative flippase GtrA